MIVSSQLNHAPQELIQPTRPAASKFSLTIRMITDDSTVSIYHLNFLLKMYKQETSHQVVCFFIHGVITQTATLFAIKELCAEVWDLGRHHNINTLNRCWCLKNCAMYLSVPRSLGTSNIHALTCEHHG